MRLAFFLKGGSSNTYSEKEVAIAVNIAVEGIFLCAFGMKIPGRNLSRSFLIKMFVLLLLFRCGA